MEKKYSELLGNTLIFAIGSISSKLILFFMVPLYTNVLSTKEYGTVDLVQTIALLSVPIISLMTQDSMLRFGLAKNVNKDVILKNSLLITMINGLIGMCIIPILNYYNSISEWRWYLYVIVMVSILTEILLAYVKVSGKNKIYSLSNILATFILSFFNIIFLLKFKWGIKGFLLSIIGSQCISIMFLLIKSECYNKILKVRLDIVLLKKMLQYSLPLVINNLSWWILNLSDKIMIEYFYGIEILGIYTVASKIPALFSMINSIFLQAWTISVIKSYEKNEDSNFCSVIFNNYSVVMFGTISFFMLVLKMFINFYVGIEYREALKYIPLLLFGSIFYGISLFFGSVYSAAKKNMYITLTTIIAAIINGVINILLLSRIGVMAASLSTAISYFFIGIYRMIDSRRFFYFKINLSNFFVNCLLCLIQTIFITIYENTMFVSFIVLIFFIINNIKILNKGYKNWKKLR